ncbi:MAG: PEP-CTERM sorting domain-containing protein [Akkermansia sp.]
MKTSYLVRRLMRPVLAVALVFTSISTSWSDGIVVSEDADSIASNVNLVVNDAAIDEDTEYSSALEVVPNVTLAQLDKDVSYVFNTGYVNGVYASDGARINSITAGSSITLTQTDADNASIQRGVYLNHASMDEMAGDITLNKVYGTSQGMVVDNSSYVKEISGNIVVNHEGAGSTNYGLLIDGNNLYKDQLTPSDSVEDTTSTVDVFSGSVSMTSDSANLRGVVLHGSYSGGIYTGGNTLGVLTSESSVDLKSNTGTVYGVRNDYCIINEMNGTVSVETGGTGYAAAYYSMGTTGSITGTYSSTHTGSSDSIGEDESIGVNRTIWNASYGHTGATIDSINATVTTTSNGGEALSIYNLGKIGSIDGSYTASSVDGGVWTLYNYYYNGISYGTIGTLEGEFSAASVTGSATAIYNKSQIGSVDVNIKSSSEESTATGIYSTGSTAKMGDVRATMSITGELEAYGVRASSSSTIGDLDVSMSVSCAIGNAYGIEQDSSSTIGDISGSMNIQTETGSAQGIMLLSTVTIGTIDADITATASDTGTAYGILTKGNEEFTFGKNASITATSVAGEAYSIYSSVDNLSLKSEGELNLTGDVSVNEGAGSFTVASGSVNITGGSTIDAASVTIESAATLGLTIVDGNTLSSNVQTLNNNGTLSLSAGVDLDEGEYQLSSNTSLSINSTGAVKTYGGTWDGNIFKVAAAESITIDVASSGVEVSANGRLVVKDATGDTSITMNFNTAGETTVSAVTTVTNATEITQGITLTQSFAEFAEATMGGTIAYAEAYHFDVSGLTEGVDSVEVVFYIGAIENIDDIAIFHLEDGIENWSTNDVIENFSYSDGYVTAYVDGFSSVGVAVSVPEPSTISLSLLALAGLCARRRRKN